ncbi:MAG: GIY-YIG nuclease family protein [Tepidisphaeraceae bacterium]
MIEASSIPAGGVYIALFHLAHARRIRVGELGTIAFPAGRYAYVGTAQRNLLARLSRHGRRRKPLKWHIDYLSVRAEMIGAIVVEGPKSLECRLATTLVHDGAEPVPGFGCTNCCCRSHLFRL